MTSIYDFSAKDIDGEPVPLEKYRGQLLLIVNVASRCGFTPQYAGLEELYQRYKDRGFQVLGFPCNQFGKQEPGGEAQIKEFCSVKFRVTFPMFAKINVNGADADPLYKYLKSQRRGTLWTKSIKWNFTKFLVGKTGEVIKRYGPLSTPKRIERRVAGLLG